MGLRRFMGFLSWMGWDGTDGWTGHASSAVTTTRSPAVQKSRTRFSKKKQGSFRSFFGRVRVAVGGTALDSALTDN